MVTRPAQRGVLSERAEDLFKRLVHRYIREGRPVGSRTLARDSGRTLSPATIRNVMADLEDLGLLSAPHTSAGRVPTVQGYRLFVDTMLHTQPLATEEVKDLEQKVDAADRADTLAETTSALLSEITHLAGIVMLPRQEQVILRHVEFLSLSDKRGPRHPRHQRARGAEPNHRDEAPLLSGRASGGRQLPQRHLRRPEPERDPRADRR